MEARGYVVGFIIIMAAGFLAYLIAGDFDKSVSYSYHIEADKVITVKDLKISSVDYKPRDLDAFFKQKYEIVVAGIYGEAISFFGIDDQGKTYFVKKRIKVTPLSALSNVSIDFRPQVFFLSQVRADVRRSWPATIAVSLAVVMVVFILISYICPGKKEGGINLQPSRM